MDVLTTLLLNLVLAGVGFVILYYVVKAAVIAGIAEDRRRTARQRAAEARRSHVDADGL